MLMCSATRLGVLLLLSSATLSDAFTTATLRHKLPPSTPSISALRVSKTAIPDLSSSTKPVDESTIFNDSEDGDEDSSWQTKIDLLLAPDTNVAERQIVLSDLLSSGEEIQESVRTALRERKVSIGCGMMNYIFAIAMGTKIFCCIVMGDLTSLLS